MKQDHVAAGEGPVTTATGFKAKGLDLQVRVNSRRPAGLLVIRLGRPDALAPAGSPFCRTAC